MATIGEQYRGASTDAHILRPVDFLRTYRNKPKKLVEEMNQKSLAELVMKHIDKIISFYMPDNLSKSIAILIQNRNHKKIFIDYYLYFDTNCKDEIEKLLIKSDDQNSDS